MVDVSGWDEKSIDDLDYAAGEWEVSLDKSASAALAADNGYDVSCLLYELNSQATSDVGPAG